uniref:Alpha tocopherol transfer protein like n=2 Tax=Coturnix japonica TaxID=93934 RepID=A0A8C2SNL1_COTJA
MQHSCGHPSSYCTKNGHAALNASTPYTVPAPRLPLRSRAPPAGCMAAQLRCVRSAAGRGGASWRLLWFRGAAAWRRRGRSDCCHMMSGDSDCTRTSPSAGSPSDTELLLLGRPKYVCSLSPDLVTKAREELQEKPEWRLRDVQALRDMVCKEYPSLGTCLDDAFLLRFLRARKFDYDRALQLLVNYHSCRRSWPEVFNNLKPSAIKPVLESGFVTVLPHRDPEGRHVVCIRPDRWTPSNYPITENIRAIYLTLEKLIQSEETQVNGIVILADYKGVSLSKASHFGPFVAKKVIGILQDGFPIRIKAVNIINEPRIFKGIFAIIKPFLKEKIANRFFLHGSDLNSLHQNIPPVILPEEYGGTAGKLDISAWNELLLASEEDFLHDFSQLVLPCDSSPHDMLVICSARTSTTKAMPAATPTET